jgi:hypothetical protein
MSKNEKELDFHIGKLLDFFQKVFAFGCSGDEKHHLISRCSKTLLSSKFIQIKKKKLERLQNHSMQWIFLILFSLIHSSQLANLRKKQPYASQITKKLENAKTIKLLRKGTGRKPSIYLFPDLITITG